MGIKERHFQSLVNVSVEALVPPDHFYRHPDSSLDLSFVRDSYARGAAGGDGTESQEVTQ